eukprot:TRINITY_DN78638_c0_g1_i1.p1 TRINITY_DN78638_c0_g1~~TRINITY_DN78638_c0_g1_i1.p1  ORF type:complete len:705 (+),score=125.39 TRINITY_DN78638_c0_g1_i1:73-2115(+)
MAPAPETDSEGRRLVAVPPPPIFDTSVAVPQFYAEGYDHSSPISVPQSVAIAAQDALEGTSSGPNATRTRPSVPRRPPPFVPRGAAVGSTSLPLEAVSTAKPQLETLQLRFGDAVRLLLPSLKDGGLLAALSSCAPVDSNRSGAGANAVNCMDAANEERRIATDLTASGRSAEGFVAMTAAPIANLQGPIARRSVWEVYRHNYQDDSPGDDVVRYGQCIRLGQRAPDGEHEVLLSCEPPSRDGAMGAPYLILGRLAGFGYPDPEEESRKAFHTVFMIMPGDCSFGEKVSELQSTLKIAKEGDPVDLKQNVRLIPASPFAYLHRQRHLQAKACVIPNSLGRGCRTITVKRTEGREMILEAGGGERPVKPESGNEYSSWMIQVLNVRRGIIEESQQRTEEVYRGLPRALLGRALGGPQPPSAHDAVPFSREALESGFARWEHVRSSIIHRLHDRGMVYFPTFRKVISKDRSTDFDLNGPPVTVPGAHQKLSLDERCLVRLDKVWEAFRLDFGLEMSEEDIIAIAEAFAFDIPGRPPVERDDPSCLIELDLFVDALRGTPSPGRQQILERLYALLQKELGVPPSTGLAIGWMENRIEAGAPKFLPGVKQRDFTQEEMMGYLPLRRLHSSLSQHEFLRWMGDITSFKPKLGDFLEALREIFGEVVDLAIGQNPLEVHQWSMPLH